MTDNVRLEYWMKMKRKEIKAKEIAEALKISDSLISKWFSSKCNVHPDTEKRIKQYIDETEKYKFVKVRID